MNILKPVPTIYGDHHEKFKKNWAHQASLLKDEFKTGIEKVLIPPKYPTDVPIVFVKKDSLIELLKFLKTNGECNYQFLSDITATDELPDKPRFHVVYQLLSHSSMMRIRVKVRVNEDEEVPTAIPLWEGANWAEREVFDMFGVRFKGHPDLRRILMDERWEGHPLRKDYPLRGYQVFPTPEPIHEDLLD